MLNKILLIILLTLVILASLLFFGSINGTNKCYMEYPVDQDHRNLTKEAVCGLEYENLDNLNSCYVLVQEQYLIKKSVSWKLLTIVKRNYNDFSALADKYSDICDWYYESQAPITY